MKKIWTEVETVEHEHEVELMLTPNHIRNFCQICQKI